MSKLIATREAYGEALLELGEIEQNLVVLDADLSGSTKTNLFAKKFPERFFDLGIAEQNLIGTAAGLAVSGKIPFVSSFAVFAAERPFEQIRNTVAHGNLNVKIAATHAGITVGEDGATHQSVEDLALMRVLPGMTVLVPADAVGAKAAVKAAAELAGPVYIRLGRSGVPSVHSEDWQMEVGKIVELRSGSDLTLLAMGITVSLCLEAAELLAADGISARVLEVHTLKPLDEAAIVQAAKQTGHLLTVEEHSIIGGLGSAVAEIVAEKAPARLGRLGMPDRFGESGTPAELLVKYGFTPENIAEKAKLLLAK